MAVRFFKEISRESRAVATLSLSVPAHGTEFSFLTWHKSRCEIAEVVMLSQCAPADDTPAPFKPSAESVVPAQLFSSPAPGHQGDAAMEEMR
jgi:hypothetical protein